MKSSLKRKHLPSNSEESTSNTGISSGSTLFNPIRTTKQQQRLRVAQLSKPLGAPTQQPQSSAATATTDLIDKQKSIQAGQTQQQKQAQQSSDAPQVANFVKQIQPQQTPHVTVNIPSDDAQVSKNQEPHNQQQVQVNSQLNKQEQNVPETYANDINKDNNLAIKLKQTQQLTNQEQHIQNKDYQNDKIPVSQDFETTPQQNNQPLLQQQQQQQPISAYRADIKPLLQQQQSIKNEVQAEKDNQHEQFKPKSQDIGNQQQNYKPQQSQQHQSKQQNIPLDQLEFNFRVSNRRRTSEGRRYQVQNGEDNLEKEIFNPEKKGQLQDRDLDKERLDIRQMARRNSTGQGNTNNGNNNNPEAISNDENNKNIEDRILRPRLSLGSQLPSKNSFAITKHTKLLKPFPKISSVLNVSAFEQIDHELRFYHLLFQLIEETANTTKLEYANSPEFLHFLDLLNDRVKSSFSRIANNRRKSIMLEQQPQVKECLFNRWERSKQRVVQNMMQKYLKKYQKFQKVENNLTASKEYSYLLKSITSLLNQAESPAAFSFQDLTQMIEDNSKKALINAEAANKAAIKPVIGGIDLIEQEEQNMLIRENQMDEAYLNLSKVVFSDWKEIESFDEFTWLGNQQKLVKTVVF